jgi:hypothetical protein
MASLELLIKPEKFMEAIRKLGRKKAIAKKLSSKQWAAMPTQIRDRAYFTANVESMKFLNRSKKMLNDYLSGARETVTTPDGRRVTALKKASRADFVYEMQKLAKETGLGDVLPPGEDMSRDMITRTKDIASESRLNLIFDTQTQQAQAYGYYKQGQDPAILDAYPCQRFIRAEQRKEPRPLHERNKNKVKRKDDMEFWLKMNDQSIGGLGVPFGPWGFNSGMDVEDVRRDKAIQMGLIQKNEQVLPPDDTFNKGLKAAADVEPEFLKKFLDKMGKDAYTNGEFVEIIEKISNVPAPAPAKKVPKKILEPEPPKPIPFKAYQAAKKKVNAVLKKYPAVKKQKKEALHNNHVKYEELQGAKDSLREKEVGRRISIIRHRDVTKAKVAKLRKEWRKTRDSLNAARQNLNKFKAKMLDAVSSKKPNNFKGDAFNTKHNPTKMRPEWQKGIDGFNRLTGDIVSDPSDALTPYIHPLTMSNKVTLTKKKRAFSSGTRGIFLNNETNAATTVHEFGHQLEGKKPWVKSMVNDWFKERLGKGLNALDETMDKMTDIEKAKDPMKVLKIGQARRKYKLRPLNKIEPNGNYESYERAFEDDFLTPYVGKVYGDGETEIVSMGLEWMFKNPAEFHAKDPDHFDLILRILKGVEEIDMQLPTTGAWNLKDGMPV